MVYNLKCCSISFRCFITKLILDKSGCRHQENMKHRAINPLVSIELSDLCFKRAIKSFSFNRAIKSFSFNRAIKSSSFNKAMKSFSFNRVIKYFSFNRPIKSFSFKELQSYVSIELLSIELPNLTIP